MVDVDHFKKFNDSYGHETGDDVLKLVAARLRLVQGRAKVYRYGGEEFLILLSNTCREAAAMVGERLRLSVMEIQHLVAGRPIELSVSLGCATLLPAESVQSLLRRADNALYVAKRDGRNRLSMAG